MDAAELAQLKGDVEVLKGAFLESLERQSQNSEYITKAFKDIGTLADALEEERHLNIVLSKIVAHIVARECCRNKNPSEMLNTMLAYHYSWAEYEETTFDDGIDEVAEILRQAGVARTPPSDEEIYVKTEEERESRLRSSSCRAMADRIRTFAIEIINAASAR